MIYCTPTFVPTITSSDCKQSQLVYLTKDSQRHTNPIEQHTRCRCWSVSYTSVFQEYQSQVDRRLRMT